MALAWSSSTMLSLSLLSPLEPTAKFGWKRCEPTTKTCSSDHLNSRIQVICGSTLAVAVSTSKSTSVSGSSGSILLNDLRGSSGGLDILGNVLESFDTISTKGQEITEKNDSQQLKIALPLRNDGHLYEFDKYLKDDLSGFSSCLAPFVEQLQECFSPSTGPQQLLQPPCASPTIPKETACENQEIATAAAVMDAVTLAKAAVEAARDVAALVEAQALQEGNGQKSFVYVTEPLRPSSAVKNNVNNIEKLADSQICEVNLYEGQFPQLDDQHSQSATSSSSPLKTVNVMVRSNRRMERKAKRERVSQKVEESRSVFPLHVHQKGKKTVIASYGPKDSIPSVLHVPDSGRLLSAEEEVELSERVQDLLKLEKVKDRLQEQLGREPTSAEWAKAVGIDKSSLESRLKTGRRCKDKMIKSNLRLVISIAKHYNYKGLGISLPDLIQAGNMGLIKGVEKFDPKRGFKFSTCAHWWILQAVTQHLSQNSRIIRRPVYFAEVWSRTRKARNLLYQEHERDPTVEELAEVVGVSVDRLRKIVKSEKTPKSFERPTGVDQETCFGEILGDTDDEDPESTIMKRLMKQDFDRLLRTLRPREREVIRLRHGLDGGRSWTLDEIGRTLKISRERTRQLELQAMRKLKLTGKARSLRNHLDVVG